MADVSADMITALVGIATAAGTAVWTVTRYLSDRRDARAESAAQAARDLEQRRVEEQRARQDRAATLIRAVGEATDPVSRRWTMSALSLYPADSLDLLLAALAEAGPQDAASIKLAVISIGTDALPAAVHAHRIARQMCSYGDLPAEEQKVPPPAADQADVDVDVENATRVVDGTRSIIVNLLLQLDEEHRRSVDLAGVDLSRVVLAQARLAGISFSASVLDGAVLARADLTRATFRGTSVAGAIFTRASMASADLTGATGAIRAIRADLSDAVLDDADLTGAVLDGVRLKGASLKRADLSGASLPGAAVTNASFDRTVLRKASAHDLSAGGVRISRADFSHADLTDGTLPGSKIEQTHLVRIEGTRLQADESTLVDVHLMGAQLPRSSWKATTFTGCDLSGATLSGAVLAQAHFTRCTFNTVDLTRIEAPSVVFEKCTIAKCDFTRATLTGAVFRECTFAGTVCLRDVALAAVAFHGCTFEDSAVLESDAASWGGADLDDAARAVFARSTSAGPLGPA